MKKIFKKLFSKDRIELIKENLKILKPFILEVGVHKGEFSNELLKSLYPKKLVLVDPWIAFQDTIYKNSWYGNSNHSNQQIQDKLYYETKKSFSKEIQENKVEILRETSDNFFLINKYKFDLIYIDGNHLYEFVRRDIDNSLNVLNENGIIVLDDYNLTGWWSDGVTKAVKFYEEKKLIKVIKRHSIFEYHHQCLIKKYP